MFRECCRVRFFFSSRRRHTRWPRDWSSDVCSSDLDRRAAVLILTAFSQRHLVEQARDAGALAYLVKPFQRSELIPAVEVALGRFKEVKALEAEVRGLEEQLETRRLVDRAKGILMDEHRLAEGAAFSFIQRNAMRQRVTMRVVASQVIDGSLRPEG